MAAARGLMLSLAGVSVCADQGLPCPLEAAGFDQGAVRSEQPVRRRSASACRSASCAVSPGSCWQLRPRLSRWRCPLPSGRGSACDGDACGRRRVPARSRPGPAQRRHREGGAAPGSPWRRHGDRDGGSRGTSRTSRAPRHGRTRFADVRKHARSRSPRFRATGSPGRSSCRRRHRR